METVTAHNIHLDIFKEQKRHVNKLISSAKSSYYTAKIIEAASDQKQLYNVVNTMLVKPEAASDQKQLYNVVNTMLVKPEAASDQKQLYNVVNTMLVKPEASLPDGRSLEHLASEFELFFQAKVKRIQENLVSDADYVPPDECPCAVGAKLDIFLPATEDEVKLLVAKSPSKSCSLDPVPTWMLKAHLDCILPSITNIVLLRRYSRSHPWIRMSWKTSDLFRICLLFQS